MNEKMVLTVPNRHIEEAGSPPELVAGPLFYTAYLENLQGEQLVFSYDRKEHRGALWHGDYGWGNPLEVLAGAAAIVLSPEESLWLDLVWRIATATEDGPGDGRNN